MNTTNPSTATSTTTTANHATTSEEPGTTTTEPAPSRRGLLRLAGAAAVGVAAATVGGGTRPAAASTGGPMLLGVANASSFNDRTTLNGPLMALADSSDSAAPIVLDNKGGTIAGWDFSNDPAVERGGVLGLAGKIGDFTSRANGVLGAMFSPGGLGAGVSGVSQSLVTGASAGVRAKSTSGPAIQLDPVFSTRPATGTWALGALVPDTTGRLWYCTAAGTPGTWIDLAAPRANVFGFRAITPTRVYDSRVATPLQGSLLVGQQRTLSVKDGRNLDTGVVTIADLIPNGASAVTANVTVVDTVGSGFLAINPGGITVVSAATVNWFGSGQILNNGVNLSIRVTDRTVTVIAGGGSTAQTHFVIDVTGYFISDAVAIVV